MDAAEIRSLEPLVSGPQTPSDGDGRHASVLGRSAVRTRGKKSGVDRLPGADRGRRIDLLAAAGKTRSRIDDRRGRGDDRVPSDSQCDCAAESHQNHPAHTSPKRRLRHRLATMQVGNVAL